MRLPPEDDWKTVVDRAPDSAPKVPPWSPLARLISEMQSGWQAGATPRVEMYFERHPELREKPEAVLRLIYEEVCQRRAQGEDVSAGELYNRFPHWHSQLQHLIGDEPWLDSTIDDGPDEPSGFQSFEFVTELGRGSGGQVYLARQTTLGNRLVVLKVTSAEDMEHLSLARLQHTNIVPLYGVFDDHAGRRHALCMPYFGCTTLFHVMSVITAIPIEKRRGADIWTVLQQREREIGVAPVNDTIEPPIWAGESYVVAICRLGAALAEALADAHQRGLLHLDIKPSNVLITADGQPMLLDFHLAREPLSPGDPPPRFFGGTPPFMPPEQVRACDDVTHQRWITLPLDARTDLYALGMLLYVALADGAPPKAGQERTHLQSQNRFVSPGLVEILVRCLATNAADRYPTAKQLAEDLRRHVQNQPLAHVPNRSLMERWRKWRRRRPFALPLWLLAIGLVSLAIVSLNASQRSFLERQQSAETIFFQGQMHLQDRQYARAAAAFAEARDMLPAELNAAPLGLAIDRGLVVSTRAQHAARLADLVDSIRLAVHSEPIDYRALIVFEVNSKAEWDDRHTILARNGAPSDARLDLAIRRQLTELALDWADIHVRIAPPEKKVQYQAFADDIIRQAREVSPSPRVIDWWLADSIADETSASSGWEWYCLGRAHRRRGDFHRAFDALKRSVQHDPADFWANFTLADTAYRLGFFDQAVVGYSVCVGQRPSLDVVYFRRGQSSAALKRWQDALRDFDRALALRPHVREVVIERGRARLAVGERKAAADDFRLALELGAEDALIRPLLEESERP